MINPSVKKIMAYKPPLEGRSKYNGLLLDFNERTVDVNPGITSALVKYLQTSQLQRYPSYSEVNEILADYVGSKADEVMISNGADQVIDVLFRTFTDSSSKVLLPEPSFAMFKQSADLVGARITTYDVFSDLEILEPVDLVVICNPNNPTGTLIPVEKIESLLKQYPQTMFFVDEVYFEFSRTTAKNLISDYSNLVIARTFSKAFGLAALRVGYAISTKQNIEQMLKVRGPYDVNSLAIVAVEAALSDPSYMYEYVDEVMGSARPLLEEFFNQNGIRFFESAANFLCFKPNFENVFEVLKEQGFLLRPQKNGYLRLTIGTKEQMVSFIETYKSNFLS